MADDRVPLLPAPPRAFDERRNLPNLLGARSVRLRRRTALKRGVYRLLLEADGRPVAVVVKRVDMGVAERVRRAMSSWLPAVGLSCVAPRVLGVAPAAARGEKWLVYHHVDGRPVATEPPVETEIQAALRVVARLHHRFAGHGLLDDCREYGNDLTGRFFEESVRGAVEALEAVTDERPRAGTTRLLAHLERLEAEGSDRVAVLEQWGGPPTLLHGDLWTTNVLVAARSEPHVWLVDWDRCGVGHASYDLSTFLLRFRRSDRRWILTEYDRAARGDGREPLAPVAALNAIFDTAERARLASCVLWAGRAVLEGHVEWGLARLEEIGGWLEALDPLIQD